MGQKPQVQFGRREVCALGLKPCVVNILFSEVDDQMVSKLGGSENQMISDMRVKNFLTRGFIGIARGQKK